MAGCGKNMPGSFEAMTNFEQRPSVQNWLSIFPFTCINLINTTQYSADGTIKSRFKTFDDHFIEGVLIPTEERKTACVSSQIGCSLSCAFLCHRQNGA